MSVEILIVDDDPQIRDVLQIALKREGYNTITASDGAAALRYAKKPSLDLIVLDIGLPEIDGLEVCRQLRTFSDIPVLFLSARDDEFDKVLGLELGADDYVTKPFSPRELVARIKSILKRTLNIPGIHKNANSKTYQQGDLMLFPNTHICRFSGQPVMLTASEMKLLKRIMQNPDTVTTRAQLTDALYGTNIHVSERTIDSHLRNLRSKLAKAGCNNAIETLHGIGFRMGSCDSR